MCSRREAQLASLRAAIDEVALAAQADPGEHPDVGELAARLAAIWAMIAELDPGLAARLRGYCPDTSLGSRGRPACGSQPWHGASQGFSGPRSAAPRRAPQSRHYRAGRADTRPAIAGVPGDLGPLGRIAGKGADANGVKQPTSPRPGAYFPTISTSIVAVTSGCSRT